MQIPADASKEAVELSISGMTCGGCASTVQRVLTRVSGVHSAHVDHRTGRAVVTGAAPAEELIAAVEAAGFGVRRTPAM